jgi:hypothetical protein
MANFEAVQGRLVEENVTGDVVVFGIVLDESCTNSGILKRRLF